VPFPEDYWSRDFRATRSNLLISVPERAESGRPAHAVAAAAVAAHA
jgi:hypothetical protein